MNPFYRALAVSSILFLAALAADAQPVELEDREILGPTVNSDAVEIVPIVSPDGQTLYFDRKHAPGNVGGERDPDDIWISQRQPDGSWGRAVNAGPPLNTSGSDVLFWISPDGDRALVYHGAYLDGDEMGLAITERTAGGWSKPKKIYIDGLPDLGNFWYAHMSPDARRLLLAIKVDRGDNRGRFEIFVTQPKGSDLSQWREPIPLDDNINTPYDDSAPFIAPDARTLYFLSDRPGGFGGNDVYVSRRLDESWTRWSEPINLGPQVNTSVAETGISVSAEGDVFYTSSTSEKSAGGYGGTDLFVQQIPLQFRPLEPVHFDFASHTLSRSEKSRLREFYENLEPFFRRNQVTEIIVTGHTDSVGAEQDNYRLGERRAATVASFLKDLGVQPTLLETRSAGESNPITDNGTERGRALNRRVTVDVNRE